MGRLRLTASAVAVATVAILTVGLARAGHQPPYHWVVAGFFVVSIVAPAAIGLLIVLRKPRNVVAWVLLLGALSTAPGDALLPSHSAWALQWGRASWPLIYAWPVAVAFVFPDGRLLSRRWRRVAAVTAFCFVAFITFAMLDPEAYDPPDQKVHNPLSGLHIPGWISWIWVPLWIGILSSLFVGAYAVRVRLRRSRGVERLQTLWLAWSAALIPAGLVWCGILGFLAPVAFPGAVGSLADNLLFPFLLVMETAVAAAVGLTLVGLVRPVRDAFWRARGRLGRTDPDPVGDSALLAATLDELVPGRARSRLQATERERAALPADLPAAVLTDLPAIIPPVDWDHPDVRPSWYHNMSSVAQAGDIEPQ